MWRKEYPPILFVKCKFVQRLWRTINRFLKKTKDRITIWSSIPLLGIYPDKTVIQKYTCTPMFTAALHTVAKTWKQPKVQRKMNAQRWRGVYLMEYYPAIKKEWNNAAMWMDLEILMGFPGSSVVKVHLQSRRPRFDPWVGKISWRKEWLPTPGFLPGKAHEQRSPVGYRAWGCKKVGYDSVTMQQRDYHSSERSQIEKTKTIHYHLYVEASSVQLLVMSNSFWPHGLQQARLPSPSPTPEACSN